jgi:hypothetical protein
MSTVQTGDTIAVYRSGTLYKAPADMSTLQDTDIIVVGRGNTPYKCTFLDWKNSQSKAPAIGGATLADSPEAGRFTSGTFATTVSGYDAGIPAATVGVKAWVEGTLKRHPQTSGIASVAGSVLTLTDATDISRFAAGDAVTEVTSTGTAGDATGTVGSVDATAKTITLSATSGTWDVGSQVKGPLKTQTVTTTPNSDEIVAVGGTAGAPILTFKSDKDLAKFAAGDAVKQDSGGTPSSPTSWPVRTGNSDTAYASATPATFANNQVVTLKVLNSDPGIRQVLIDTSALPIGWMLNLVGITSPITVRTELTDTQFIDNANAWNYENTSSDIQLTAATPGIKRYVFIGILNPVLTTFTFGGNIGQPRGTVGSVNTTVKTMTLATSHGTWGPANAGHYVIGPTKTGPASNVKLYCKLNATLNVQDLQSADPGYVTMTGNSPYTLTWPATLPSGNPPDTDLPAGTTITTEVQATNSSGTVTKTSNTVTPA